MHFSIPYVPKFNQHILLWNHWFKHASRVSCDRSPGEIIVTKTFLRSELIFNYINIIQPFSILTNTQRLIANGLARGMVDAGSCALTSVVMLNWCFNSISDYDITARPWKKEEAISNINNKFIYIYGYSFSLLSESTKLIAKNANKTLIC